MQIMQELIDAYICLNRTLANIKTADPVMSPMTADKITKMSVRITSI